MTSSVTVRHNFECGHRLPILPGKCTNLHGHSWWCEVTVTADQPAAGVVIEFGLFKKQLRDWIDTHLDHGLMLGATDPLVAMLAAEGKVFQFDAKAGGPTRGLGWPTVENTAIMLGRVAARIVADIQHAPGAQVTRVTVQETHVNTATWEP